VSVLRNPIAWQDQSGQDKYTTEVVLPAFNSKLVMLDRVGGNGAGSYEDQDDQITVLELTLTPRFVAATILPLTRSGGLSASGEPLPSPSAFLPSVSAFSALASPSAFSALPAP
jgi:single-stranded DNA-binding protein